MQHPFTAAFALAIALSSLSCGLSRESSGSSSAKAALETAMAEALGPQWTVSRQGSETTVTAARPPVIVNLLGRSPHDVRELEGLGTESARQRFMAERFRVPIDIRIVIRTSLKLTPSEVAQRLSANRRLEADLRGLARYESSIFQKVDLGDDGPAMAGRYAALWGRAEQIPAGYYKDLSVFVSKTNLGSARFLEAEDEDRLWEAIRTISGLLDQYGGVRLRTAGDDECRYNRRGDTVSVACPW